MYLQIVIGCQLTMITKLLIRIHTFHKICCLQCIQILELCNIDLYGSKDDIKNLLRVSSLQLCLLVLGFHKKKAEV